MTRAGTRLLLLLLAVSQPELPHNNRPAERDKKMSEQKRNYMSTLDAWTDEHILLPMSEVLKAYFEAPEEVRRSDEKYDESLWNMDALIKKAIREKVLESYNNGRVAPVKFKQKGRVWKKQ